MRQKKIYIFLHELSYTEMVKFLDSPLESFWCLHAQRSVLIFSVRIFIWVLIFSVRIFIRVLIFSVRIFIWVLRVLQLYKLLCFLPEYSENFNQIILYVALCLESIRYIK